MRVAVDAFNLVADRRGMGRFTRSVLAALSLEPDLSLTLIARTPRDLPALRSEFSFDALALRDIKRDAFDAAWYPWNGMRFRAARWNVVTMHDAFAFTQPARDFVGRWKEQAPIRRAAREAHALTTVSHWSARQLGETLHLPKKRFAITPPVPDPFFVPVDVEEPVKPFFFAVGGPDERKNIPLLIEAWLRAFPDRAVDLHVAGTLNDSNERLAAKSGVRRSKPDDATLRELYAQAIAVAVPSTSEGYGLMSVEAMACGAPVIAAEAAGLPEACDGAALLLPATDVDRWSQTLREIAGDESQRRALHERSLERVARIDRTAAPRIIAALLRRSREAAR